MTKTIIVCWGILIILFCCSGVSAQMPDWYSQIKKIKILKDNREDIINIFGEPNNTNDKYYISYKNENFSMDFEFSSGLCKTTKEDGWNVPEFIVTDVYVYLYKKISYQKLKLNLKNLHKEEIFDVPGAFIYHNLEKGESYSIDSKGILESVDLKPGKKDNHLFCKN